MTALEAAAWGRYISPRAADTTLTRGGAAGRRWLESLPTLVTAVETRHGIVVGEALGGGALSAVCTATDADGPLIVKFCANSDLAAAEAATLNAWARTAQWAGVDRPTPRVLWEEPALGGYAMELAAGTPWRTRIEGGLSAADRSRANTAVAGVLQVIAITAPLPTIPTAEVLHGTTAVLQAVDSDPALARFAGPATRGVAMLDELHANPAAFVATHGDLWSGNVLDDGATGTVIDPFPVSGPIECDAARWCSDGWWGSGYRDRVEQLADTCHLEPDTLDALAGFYAAAQAATFARHGWDATAVEAGWDDILTELT